METLNPMRDKNEGTYRGEKGGAPVTTVGPEEGREGRNLLPVRVKLESKIHDRKKDRKKTITGGHS